MKSLEVYRDEILLPKLLENRDDFPKYASKLIRKNQEFDISDIANVLRQLPENINSSLRHYFLINYLILLEDFPTIDRDYINYIIYALKIMKTLPEINWKEAVNRTADACLKRAIEPPIRLENLLSEYSYLLEIRSNLEFNPSSQLSGIEAFYKCNILRTVGSLDNLVTGLEKLEQGSRLMGLASTKKLFLTLFSQYKDSIPDRKLEEYKKRFEDIGTEYNNEFDKVAIPSPSQSNNETSGIIRLNQIHYHPGDPEVTIWECTKPGIQGRFALKEIKSYDQNLLNQFSEEANTLKRLSDMNLDSFVKFYGKSLTKEKFGNREKHILTIEMELVGQNLYRHREDKLKSNVDYTELELSHIIMQLISAFNTLLTAKIVHNDIKPENILITDDLCIKIIDFNISRALSYTTTPISAAGTVMFMAPEVRKAYENNQKVTSKGEKSDVFSLGLTILYLVADCSLTDFNKEEKKNLLESTINTIKYPWIVGILTRMLDFNPATRISLPDLLSNSKVQSTNQNV